MQDDLFGAKYTAKIGTKVVPVRIVGQKCWIGVNTGRKVSSTTGWRIEFRRDVGLSEQAARSPVAHPLIVLASAFS